MIYRSKIKGKVLEKALGKLAVDLSNSEFGIVYKPFRKGKFWYCQIAKAYKNNHENWMKDFPSAIAFIQVLLNVNNFKDGSGETTV